MTLFTKFGNWFLRNSRNVFLIFIINYIVMIQIGNNLIGKLVWFLLSGELSSVFSKDGAYGKFESLTDVSVVISRLFYPTKFIFIFCLVAFVLAIVVLLFLKSNFMNLSNGHIKILLLSQFLVIILIFIDLIGKMPELWLFHFGGAGVDKLFVYVASMFFTNAMFWIIYFKAMLKPELPHQI